MKTLPPDTRLRERYRILGTLGRGGQSQVYLAADEHRGDRTVVIKNLIFHSHDASVRREELALFLQEPTILGAVSHPSLPALVDSFAEPDGHYFVEERVGTMDLDGLMRRRGGCMALEEVAWLAHHMLDLLDYLHRQSPPVVVRDVKPSNITCPVDEYLGIDLAGCPWFIDLTIAMRYVAGVQDEVKMGSPGYAPPEQYRGQTEPRSDLYALGATLFQALTGHDPVGTPFAMPPVHAYRPDLSRGWDHFFQRALTLDVAYRFKSAAEMREALERLMPLEMARRGVRARPMGGGLRSTLGRLGGGGWTRQWTEGLPRRREVLSRYQAVLVLIAAVLAVLGLMAAFGGLPGHAASRSSPRAARWMLPPAVTTTERR